MAKLGVLAFVSALVISGPAYAQDDFNGASQILRGDYAGAERVIVAQQRMFPTDPDLLLNLATAYQRTGRMAQARALYRAVLSRPDEPLDLPNSAQPRSSHALAVRALGQIDQTR